MSSLKDSQFVASPRFSYYGAMCAPELMDPKMDLGMRRMNRNLVAEKLSSGEIPMDFTPAGLHALFDKLFQLEASFRCACPVCPRCVASCQHVLLACMQTSWRSGNSLAQTLMVCLYLHEPVLALLRARLGITATAAPSTTAPTAGGSDAAPVVIPVAEAAVSFPALPVGTAAHTLALALYAYCLATLKLTELEGYVIIAADVHEEEDRVNDNSYPASVPLISMKDTIAVLRDAEAALLASVRALRVAGDAPAAGAGKAAGGGGKAKKKQKAKLANLGITTGVDPLPVTTSSFPADGNYAEFKGVIEAVVGADGVAVVDALIARLRLKRSHILAHLYFVSDVPGFVLHRIVICSHLTLQNVEMLRAMPEAAEAFENCLALTAIVGSTLTVDADAVAAAAAIPTDPVRERSSAKSCDGIHASGTRLLVTGGEGGVLALCQDQPAHCCTVRTAWLLH